MLSRFMGAGRGAGLPAAGVLAAGVCDIVKADVDGGERGLEVQTTKANAPSPSTIQPSWCVDGKLLPSLPLGSGCAVVDSRPTCTRI